MLCKEFIQNCMMYQNKSIKYQLIDLLKKYDNFLDSIADCYDPIEWLHLYASFIDTINYFNIDVLDVIL